MIRYYSEHPITPTALEIIREAKSIALGDEPVDFVEVQAPGKGVLSFGVDAPGAVRTLSVPQVTTQPFAVSALVEAFQLIKNGSDVPPMPTPHVNPQWLFDFDQPVVVDVENAPDGTLLSIAVCDGTRVAVYTDDHLFGFVAETLARFYYIIGHNLKYDVKVIERNTGYRLNQFFDTMLARHVMHPSAQGHFGLKDVARTVLGVGDWEADIKEYTKSGDYSLIPQEKLVQYNGYDVWYTWHLYERFKPLVEHDPAFWHEMRAARTVYLPEFHGIAVDLEHIQNLKENLTAEAAQHREKLPMANPGSWQQVLRAIEAEGVPVAFKPKGMSTAAWESQKKSLAKKGIVTSTGEEVLEGLTDRVSFVPDLLAWRGATKALSTYCNSYLDKHQDGILYPTYNVHGTSTGRLSSSDPNQQNVPRDKRFRSIFVSRNRENGLFVNADYSQIELRTMALLSGDEAMQAMFQPGMPDYFDSIIPNAFPEYTFDQYIELKETDPVLAKELRTTLKSVVYGLSFGRGAAAIAHATGTTTAYAQNVIDNYLAGFPKLAEWRQRVMEAAVDPAKRDMLVTPFGRRFESEVVTSRNRQNVINAALAFLPQSTASDICVDAAAEVVKRAPEGVLLVGLVHDAQMYDVTVPEAAGALVQVLEDELPAAGARVFGDVVPFDIEVEVGETWT